jgi:hypothetical protein
MTQPMQRSESRSPRRPSQRQASEAVTAAIAGILFVLAPAPASAQGSPWTDDFGYVMAETPYDWVELASEPGASNLSGITSGNTAEIVTLPWNFPYYAASYGELRVGGSGAAGFSYTNHTNSFSQVGPLPTSGLGSNTPDLAVHSDNFAGAPNFGAPVWSWHDILADRFIVSWEDAPRNFSSSGVFSHPRSFQLHLYPTGRIEYHYELLSSGQFDFGSSASVGIQDYAGGSHTSGNFLQFSNHEPILQEQWALAFVPPGRHRAGVRLLGHPRLAHPAG